MKLHRATSGSLLFLGVVAVGALAQRPGAMMPGQTPGPGPGFRAYDPSHYPPPSSEPAFVGVVSIKNTSPESVADMLRQVYGTQWRFVADERTRSLVISGPGDMPTGMKEMLSRLDATPEPTEIRVFELKYAGPEQACQMLMGLLGEHFQCSPDPATRSIIVKGPSAAWKAVQGLLERLDRPPSTAGGEPHFSITPLPGPYTEELVRDLVKVVGAPDLQIAYDSVHGAVISSGSQESTQRLARALGMLQQARPPAASQPASIEPFRIRLAWLVSHQGQEVPPDLRPVVEELGHIGVNVPWLAVQTVVQTNSGNASIIARPGDMELMLECKQKSGPSALKGLFGVQLRAVNKTSAPPGAPPGASPRLNEVVNVNTELELPLGHPVVLAVTPTGDEQTAAFVLEFLPAK